MVVPEYNHLVHFTKQCNGVGLRMTWFSFPAKREEVPAIDIGSLDLSLRKERERSGRAGACPAGATDLQPNKQKSMAIIFSASAPLPTTTTATTTTAVVPIDSTRERYNYNNNHGSLRSDPTNGEFHLAGGS